jgi:6-phosphogluconolactonase
MVEIRLLHAKDPVLEAAGQFRRSFEAIQERQGFVRMAIPGGSALAAFGPFKAGLDAKAWECTRLTWVDERCVPQDHPDSNRGEAYRAGLLSVTDPPGRVLPLYLDGETPQEACRRAEEVLRRDFDGALDLVLLGLGEDGHIASLFPGHPWVPAPARIQIVEGSPKPPADRLSFTLSYLASATDLLLLALGAGKREALRRLLRQDPSLPASRLPRLTIVTDQEL